MGDGGRGRSGASVTGDLMTYAPASLTALGRYWTSHGGVNLGVVGDTAHQAKGISYHLGADKLASGAYSARTTRDTAGLSNAASAIDLGKLGGSLAKLRTFSRWLVNRCLVAKCPDIREVIYSPDGSTVWRWESLDNQLRTGPGQGDLSHLGHTHISFFRDSEKRDKVGLFRPYFEPAAEPVPEAGVTVVTIEKFPAPRKFGTLLTITALRRFSATAELSPIPVPYSGAVDGTVTIEGNPSSPRGAGFLRLASGGSAGRYILSSQVRLE